MTQRYNYSSSILFKRCFNVFTLVKRDINKIIGENGIKDEMRILEIHKIIKTVSNYFYYFFR